MKHFDAIYDLAADNYGIVTAAEAAELGVARSELSRFVKAGWLRRLGTGVYKLVRYVPTPLDAYAEAVALVGPDSWIHGESVLAMCELALANPSKVKVATERRLRKVLPAWISIAKPDKDERTALYEGIPAQRIADAIRSCRNAILPERLQQAVDDALANGLIAEAEADELRKELAA